MLNLNIVQVTLERPLGCGDIDICQNIWFVHIKNIIYIKRKTKMEQRHFVFRYLIIITESLVLTFIKNIAMSMDDVYRIGISFISIASKSTNRCSYVLSPLLLTQKICRFLGSYKFVGASTNVVLPYMSHCLTVPNTVFFCLVI